MGNIVEDWLHSLKLRMYAESFIENGYDDLEICKQIGPADLDAIGVFNYSHRSQLLDAVRLMREEGAASVYFTLEEVRRKSQRCEDCGECSECCSEAQEVKSPSEEPAREGSPQRQKMEREELKDTIQKLLFHDCVDLSVPPYSKSDGTAGTIEGLASQYADQLRTFYADVLEIVEMIREGEWNRKMENLKSRRRSQNQSSVKKQPRKSDVGASISSMVSSVESVASDKALGRPSDESEGIRSSTSSAASSSGAVQQKPESRECSAERTTGDDDDGADGFYHPGRYLPSSCLSDAEGEEIYGYRYSLLVPPGCRPPGATCTEACCAPVAGIPPYAPELLGGPCFCNCGEQHPVAPVQMEVPQCLCAHCLANARVQVHHGSNMGATSAVPNRLSSKTKQRHSTLSRIFRTLRVAKNKATSQATGGKKSDGNSSPGFECMAADPLITPMPPTLPPSSVASTAQASTYGLGLAADRRRVPRTQCKDEYHPSDVSSSSGSSSVSNGPLSESRETVLSGSKSDSTKVDSDPKGDSRSAASSDSQGRGHRQPQQPSERQNRRSDEGQEKLESQRHGRRTKYLQSGCINDADAEEMYGYKCRLVPRSTLHLASRDPVAYSSMGDICYQVGMHGCEPDLRGACMSPGCYCGCPVGCGDHTSLPPMQAGPNGRLAPSSAAMRAQLPPGSRMPTAGMQHGHFPHGHGHGHGQLQVAHPSLPGFYSSHASSSNAPNGKKRNSALSRIFPTLRASKKGASGAKRAAKQNKGGSEGEAGFGRTCGEEQMLAADPLLAPALGEWAEVPRMPLRNLNHMLDGCDDRHSDPGTQDGHHYAVPMVGPSSHLVSCSACTLEPGSEVYAAGRISISEAVHRYKEIERRKKEKTSPVGPASPPGRMMSNNPASPVVHERGDSDSTSNFSSMNAPSSPPSESGSSTHPLIPPSSGRSSFSEDRMSMFGVDRRKKDGSGNVRGGVWSYRKTALDEAASSPPSPAPLSPPLTNSESGLVQLGGIGGIGGVGNGVAPIAYARALCSSYESGPLVGSGQSGRILDFKKGDSIEVLWSNGSGAWIGRCNGKMGWFPASSVMLVSPAIGHTTGNNNPSNAPPSGQESRRRPTDQLPAINAVRPRPGKPTWGVPGKQTVT